MEIALPFILIVAGVIFVCIYAPQEEPSYDVVSESVV